MTTDMHQSPDNPAESTVARNPPDSAAGGPAGQRRHLYLVGLLAFTSGCGDVVALLALGGAFTSVITGNLIFIGRAAGTESLSPAVHAVIAVLGYMAGVLVGAVVIRVLERAKTPSAPWPLRATAVFAVEGAILVAVNAVWFGYGTHPPASAQDALLVAVAAALGMQGAGARAIEGTPSTTYMTGALTSLVSSLATGQRHKTDASAAVGLVGLVAGAGLCAALVLHVRWAALLPPLITLALVVGLKARHHLDEARAANAE